jgi:hypothetical protein
MRRLFILPIFLALAACGIATADDPPTSTPPPVEVSAGPSAFADATTVDEQAGSAVELAYMAARTACELAVDMGRIQGETATRWRDLNRRAYAAVQVARTAYRAGNERSYQAAAGQALPLIAELLSLARGG